MYLIFNVNSLSCFRFEKGCGASIQFFKLVNEIFGYGAGDSLMAITLNYLSNYIKTRKHIK